MIEDWVRSNFDVVKSASGAEELVVCCPFCAHDTHFHLYINAAKSAVYCHKCGWSGNWYSLIREVSGAESYAEMYQQLRAPTSTVRDYQTVVAQLAARKAERDKAAITDMPEWYRPFDPVNQPYHAHIVMRYALKRVGWDAITRYGMGYCVDTLSPLALRLILPVERGYYQARAVNNHATQKYLSTTTPMEDRLFNGQALNGRDHVFVCEGIISAIATGDNAIATMGANGATNEQRKRLVRSKVTRFTLVVEPEKVARDKAIVLGDYLVGYGKRVDMRQFTMGDPADSDMYTEFRYDLGYKRKLMHSAAQP